eukprot:779233_1
MTFQNSSFEFKCQFCDLEFNDTDSLIQHLTELHPLSCSTTNSEEQLPIPKSTLAHTQSSSSNYQPVSNDTASSDGPTSGESFDTHTSLTEHQLEHGDESPFQCDISDCQKSFTSRKALNRHKITHSDIRLFQCNLCEKAFKRKSTFVSHQRLHSDERPFQCDVPDCQKSLKSRTALTTHRS